MPKVFRIGYVEMMTPRLSQLSEYYEAVLGLQRIEATSASSYFSLGLDNHNVAMQAGAAAGLSCIGLQVNRDVVLTELARELKELGLEVRRKTDARPGVSELIEVTPPGEISVELFQSMTMPAPGFSGRGVSPIRLGHVAIMASDPDKVVKFYAHALGFQITDWFEELATFMTCNADHHAINIIRGTSSRVHHIAFQVRDRSHHCEAADFLAQVGIATLWGPARHTAGHNFAAYHYDPDRTIIELYTDMDVLLPELGIFEPRPWHEDRPQKPKVWQVGDFTTWRTGYEFDFDLSQ